MSNGKIYEVRFSRAARKYYEKCDHNIAKRLDDCFSDLEQNPFPPNPRIKKLRGSPYGIRRKLIRNLFHGVNLKGVMVIESVNSE